MYKVGYNSSMANPPDTIFTRIIKGEIPSYKVYEDNYTYAFLDIHPVQPGMVLVVTKLPAETFLDLPEDHYLALWRSVQKIGLHMREVFPDKRRIGVQVEGLDVPHVHVKLIPVNSGAEFRAEPPSGEPNHDDLAAMAKRLAI